MATEINEYRAAEEIPVLFLKEKLQKLGVFVDYDEGQICFYGEHNRSPVQHTDFSPQKCF